MRVDHIFNLNKLPPTSADFCLLPYGMVVELPPIWSLAADRPILILFKHSHLDIFHSYVVVISL